MSEPPVPCPFTVVIDTREQRPYQFMTLRARQKQGGGPLRVSVKPRGLKSGDYSIEGMEDRVTIERKSLEDLYGTLGGRRVRFIKELERLAEMDHASVVIEASLLRVISDPPFYSSLNPATIAPSIIAWTQRYGVHFWFAESREIGEAVTFRILERFWIDNAQSPRGLGSEKGEGKR